MPGKRLLHLEVPQMDRQHIESTSIRSVGYEPQDATLEIEFLHGGIYLYFSVPPLVYEQLRGAESKGAGFHEFIRSGGYKFSRIR
jgi:hypothetical protein